MFIIRTIMETGCLLETRKSEDFHEAYVNKQSINTKILGYVPYENKKKSRAYKKRQPLYIFGAPWNGQNKTVK